jgi:hypothetical protein
MSSVGRAANSSGCVARPKGRELGLIGFAAQIRRSSLTGSYVMETAEHREPCESRGSRTVLGAPGGAIPPGDSTNPVIVVMSANDRSSFRKQTFVPDLAMSRKYHEAASPSPMYPRLGNTAPQRRCEAFSEVRVLL